MGKNRFALAGVLLGLAGLMGLAAIRGAPPRPAENKPASTPDAPGATHAPSLGYLTMKLPNGLDLRVVMPRCGTLKP